MTLRPSRALSLASALALLGCSSNDDEDTTASGGAPGDDSTSSGGSTNGDVTGSGATAGAAGDTAADDSPTAPLDCDDSTVTCYDFGPVDVPPGGEWQGFSAFDLVNPDERAIVGIEVDQLGTTSHHFIISSWSGAEPPPLGGPYDLFTDPEAAGFALDVLGDILAGTIYQYVRIDTGSFIGIRVPANTYLVNNGHYLNTSTEPATGETRIKIETVPADEVRFLAVETQPSAGPINVPPGAIDTVGHRWEPPSDVAVLLMTSHMHRHGTLFEVWSTVDGVEEKIYSTTEYDAPPLQIFATDDTPPLVLRKDRGDSLRFECTFENYDLNVPLVFGPTAAEHEMCIMPIYYIDDPDGLVALMGQGVEHSGFGWDYTP